VAGKSWALSVCFSYPSAKTVVITKSWRWFYRSRLMQSKSMLQLSGMKTWYVMCNNGSALLSTICCCQSWLMSASLKTIMYFGYDACKNQFMACLLYENIFSSTYRLFFT
jgi:hypothetical protein